MYVSISKDDAFFITHVLRDSLKALNNEEENFRKKIDSLESDFQALSDNSKNDYSSTYIETKCKADDVLKIIMKKKEDLVKSIDILVSASAKEG